VSSSPSARARRRCSARRLRGGVREQRYQQPSRCSADTSGRAKSAASPTGDVLHIS
jgi:hypothetical protein